MSHPEASASVDETRDPSGGLPALPKFLPLVFLAAGLIGAGAFFYWWRYMAFYDVGYSPHQPIPFSHALHAGTYQIDCQYCHFNAERGKHAGAPPLSVCLGCHGPDQGAVANHKPSIKKLLELTADESYADDRDFDRNTEGLRKEGGVIHWNRVHKLPDHVYFAHEWHIQAGVACQTCHGPVEEMEEVAQFADLNMGWCLNCHRDEHYTTLATKRSDPHTRWSENDPDAAERFQVGTANYEVIRERIRPDAVVPFNQRQVAGTDHQTTDETDEQANEQSIGSALRWGFDGSHDDAPKGDRVGYFNQTQSKTLKRLFAKYPDLPRWRVADLPESHRAFYGETLLQNAPTQCSTCHQ